MEATIITTAIEKFKAQTQLNVSTLNADAPNVFLEGAIRIYRNNNEVAFFLEVKEKILPETVSRIIARTNHLQPLILVSNYISTSARRILRDRNIAYIDTVGNAYVNTDGIYVFIETNSTDRITETSLNRAFSTSGLKVIYLFLLQPDALNKPYRFIGEQAKVSIDTVRYVIKGLLQDRWIVQTKSKTYEFNNRKKLFLEWVSAYRTRLLPKLKSKTFKWLVPPRNWKDIQLPAHCYWGGAAGAAFLTDYLIVDKLTIYSSIPVVELMRNLKIVPATDGTITVIEPFWNVANDMDRLSSLLIYADLVSEQDARYMETANKIYEGYVEDWL